MPDDAKKSRALTYVQFLITFVAGGLGGAVFNTWWANRSTIVTYTTTSTTLGTDQRVKSLLPEIKIQVGTQEIPLIHTHTVELRPQKGPYADKAEVALMFPSDVRLLSKPVIETPSPLHHMSCNDPVQNSITCQISPLAPGNGFFRVSIASTGANTAPSISMVAKAVELARAETVLANEKSPFLETTTILALIASLFGALLVRKLDRALERMKSVTVEKQ